MNAPLQRNPALWRQASTEELVALVSSHLDSLSLPELRQLLFNPFVSAEILETLAVHRRLMAIYAAREALLRHPRLPEKSGLRLLPGLFWRELTRIATDQRLTGGLRQAAEQLLLQRLARLALGEKIALARQAPPAVLTELCREGLEPVVAALLDHPRLTEAVLVPLLINARAKPQALALVGRHQRWGASYSVRATLCRNPQSPFSLVLPWLESLHLEDLEGLTLLAPLSSVIRNRAGELLEARKGGVDSEVRTTIQHGDIEICG